MTQKDTHEIFSRKMKDKYVDDYCLVTEYESPDKKVEIMHRKCDRTFSLIPRYALSSQAPQILCPMCRIEEQQIVRMVEVKRKIFELIGNEYLIEGTKKTSRTVKIKHNIVSCNYEYVVNPYDFLVKGSRCPKCAGLKRRTTDEYKGIVKELVGNEYVVLGDYINSNTPITMKHNLCNRTFDVKPTKFIHRNIRCAHCLKEKTMNIYSFSTKVQEMYGKDYIVLDEYIDSTSKVRIKHNVKHCGREFTKTPEKFIKRKQECLCVSEKRTKDRHTKCFKDKLQRHFGDEYILAGEYTSANEKVAIKHNVEHCGFIFHPVSKLLFKDNQKCPLCFDNSSKGETRIRKFLETNSIPFSAQFYFDECRNKLPLRFDFALHLTDDKLILIEYDGKQHFYPVDFAGKGEAWALKEFQRIQQSDNIKNQFTKNKGIPLIRIPYTDYENIESILHEELLNKSVVKNDSCDLKSVVS